MILMVEMSRLIRILLNDSVAGTADIHTLFSFRHTWISKQTAKDYKVWLQISKPLYLF